MITIEVDGGYRSSQRGKYRYMGIGVVVLKGTDVIFECSKYFRGGNSDICELLAIMWGIKIALKNGYYDAIIYTDSRSSIKLINWNTTDHESRCRNGLVAEIHKQMCNSNLQIFWQNRSFTKRAHFLATQALEAFRLENGIEGIEIRNGVIKSGAVRSGLKRRP